MSYEVWISDDHLTEPELEARDEADRAAVEHARRTAEAMLPKAPGEPDANYWAARCGTLRAELEMLASRLERRLQ